MATEKKKKVLKELKGTEVPKQTFKVDDKTYKFNVGKYIIPGAGRTLAADALKNPAELERLVEVNSGVIQLVK